MTNDLYTWPSHLYSLYLIIATQPSLRDWGIEKSILPGVETPGYAQMPLRGRGIEFEHPLSGFSLHDELELLLQAGLET